MSVSHGATYWLYHAASQTGNKLNSSNTVHRIGPSKYTTIRPTYSLACCTSCMTSTTTDFIVSSCAPPYTWSTDQYTDNVNTFRAGTDNTTCTVLVHIRGLHNVHIAYIAPCHALPNNMPACSRTRQEAAIHSLTQLSCCNEGNQYWGLIKLPIFTRPPIDRSTARRLVGLPVMTTCHDNRNLRVISRWCCLKQKVPNRHLDWSHTRVSRMRTYD